MLTIQDVPQNIIDRAIEVFDNAQNAEIWLLTPNAMLNHQIPAVVANTQEGQPAVLDLLARIEHGIFS